MSLFGRYRGSIAFGESRGKNLEVSREFGVKRFPVIVSVVEEDGEVRVVGRFEGDIKNVDEIVDWVEGGKKKKEKKKKT